MLALGLSLGVPTHQSLFPSAAEIATVDAWGNAGSVVVTDAGLTQFGVASGIKIALAPGLNENWRRAFHQPSINLAPGVAYRGQVWYLAGASGAIILEGWGHGGGIHIRLSGPVGAVAVNAATNVTVSTLSNSITAGMHLLEFEVTISAAAPGPVMLGIGPYATQAGQDVILLAALLKPAP